MTTDTRTGARYLTVRYLAETITTDDDGQTVEGAHGLIVDPDDPSLATFVDMTGVVGAAARAVLDEHGVQLDLREAVDALQRFAPFDFVDTRDNGSAVAYLADLPLVDPDEPHVRAVSIEGHPRAVRAVLRASGAV